jgi:hypothetical protein
MAYAPPLSQQGWLERFGFLERAGDKWWPLAAGVYGIEAVKRQRGMRLITPAWKTAKPAKGLVVAAGNERHPHARYRQRRASCVIRKNKPASLSSTGQQNRET